MTDLNKIPEKNLIACPSCDALYIRPQHIQHAHVLTCRACHSPLKHGIADCRRAFIYAVTAIILFIIANSFAFITLTLQGSTTTISIFSSVQSLFNHGLTVLGIIVMMFIMIMPLYYLLAVLWVLISFRFKIMNHFSRQFLHWLHHISPWNMLEVYLVGVAVTLVKMMTMASVKFENGFWAFLALMICSILANSHFDVNDAIFQAYDND